MTGPTRRTLLTLATVLAIGCAEAHRTGELAGPCAREVCDDGLVCERGVCVLPSASDDAGIDAAHDATVEEDAGPVDAGPDAPWDASLVPPDPPPPRRDTGPRLPPPGAAVHEAWTGFDDAALDWERHRLFLSQGGAGTVEVVDLVSGARGAVTTGYRAEALVFDPIRDEVVVALATGLHYGSFADPQQGYLTTIDPASLAVREPISFALDPWDIVADGDGHVHASGALGRYAATIDLETGSSRVFVALDGHHRGAIELHPDGDRAYGAGVDGYQLFRLDLEDGQVLRTQVASLDFDHPPCGALRVDPRGGAVHTGCGDVFRATNVPATDMKWIADLGIEWRDLAFDPSGERIYVVAEDGAAEVVVYDATSLERVGAIATMGPPLRVITAHEYLVILVDVLGGSPGTLVVVRPYDAL